VDSNNYAYVTGYTDSNLPTPFPTTGGAYQVALAGEVDAFVTKMAQDGASLVYSTYLGGDYEDYAHELALDSEGHAYATGKTEGPGDFPTTAGAFQTSFGGGNYDVFVTKLSLTGDALDYSTYFGGDSFDLAEGIAVDPDNNAYFAGETWSSTGTLPVTSDAFQPAYAGNGDAFAAKLSPAGDALVYSSYLGGTGWDIGTGIALDPDDRAYVSGWTQSGDFPTTDGAFMENPGGVSYPDIWDAFAAKIVASCNLTIDSTAGGSVTDPGEDTYTYEKGTVVNLVAAADTGYQFVEWTGDVGTIDDVNADTTTITMEDDYSITANFEEEAGGPGPGGCFIATAAYGTPMAEEIQVLREFRDEYLLTNPVGKGLVDLYYRGSPPVAEFITEHPGLKPIVRAGLVPAVVMSAVAVNTTPAEKALIVGVLVLVSVALAIWATRRRGRGPEYT
jgi:uncharacterized repeat protein (TIGR02543 family)